MRLRNYAILAAGLLASLPVMAQTTKCEAVGGVLFTNINAIDNTINLGPVFGDLKGSVAAKIVSQNPDGTFTLQHYWVTDSGDTILFKTAVLKPSGVSPSDPAVVAVVWGNYASDISGGTGKYKDATGRLEYFGLADFKQLTLVLRFRGEICFKQ